MVEVSGAYADAAAVEAAADEALSTGGIVVFGRYAIVADTVMVEAAANGHPTPVPTTRLVRCDGRVAHLFRLPGEVSR